MFTFLLILAIISGAFAQKPRAACSPTPTQADDPIRYAFLNEHNKIRRQLATGILNDGGGALPGSINEFRMNYNCDLEIMATVAGYGCPAKATTMNGRSINHQMVPSPNGAPTNADSVTAITNTVMPRWIETGYYDMLDRTTVVYKSEDTAPFARIIFNESISLGCAVTFCAPLRSTYTCVYSSSPVIGKPLYWRSTKTTGCTSNAHCRKVIAGSTCITAATDEQNLCETSEMEVASTGSMDETTQQSTVSSAPGASSSSMPAQTTPSANGGMTDAIRQRVVDLHNNDRSLLAQGMVRNGKVGKPNCGAATNMLKMKYDMTLETEAQTYASSCALVDSAVTSRPQSGENTYVIQSTTITTQSALEQAIQAWWQQISVNGVNAKMLYSSYLSTKSPSLNRFTQMAWAATYKIGCGVSVCSSSTFVVCRYSPRGNIVNEYIYTVGTMCGTCSGTCAAGLCPTPAT